MYSGLPLLEAVSKDASMADNVLFEITEAHLNSGMRGFPVGTCRTSRVDPYEGVSYVGYPIKELAHLDP
ncbi:MAG: hypothetical protein ACI9MC_004115, partial [Kiritimatiellia bacterium]